MNKSPLLNVRALVSVVTLGYLGSSKVVLTHLVHIYRTLLC